MVEHDFAPFDKEIQSHKVQREGIGKYAVSAAFFYAADLWVDKPPLVSKMALNYAKQQWGDQADKVWTLKRAEIPRLDGCKISQSGLIYEHVTTGGMFLTFILDSLKERQGVLDPIKVASWIYENFQTAWITREEDRELTKKGYKSQRGKNLAEAREKYKECGIEDSDRPENVPAKVRVGDDDIEDEPVQDRVSDDGVNADSALQEVVKANSKYAPFFEAVTRCLKERNSQVSIGHQRDDYYAILKGFNAFHADAVLILDAPRGAKVRKPVLSLEAETSQPGEEPTTTEWAALRDTFFSPEWRISYGRNNGNMNQLCRLKRSLANEFDIAHESSRDEAAKRTAAKIDALWNCLPE